MPSPVPQDVTLVGWGAVGAAKGGAAAVGTRGQGADAAASHIAEQQPPVT